MKAPGRILLFILLVSPALAGCSGTASEEEGTTTPVWTDGTWSSLVTDQERAGEPSIAVAPDGTVYVVAPGVEKEGATAANQFWRSDDGGHTWTYLGTVAAEYGTNDAHIAVQPDGTVWVATLWARRVPPGLLLNACIAVSRSTDRGETWDTQGLACMNPTYAERPWLTVSDDQVFLLHPCAAVVGVCLSATQDDSAWVNRPVPVPPGGVFSPPAYAGGRLSFAYVLPDPAAGSTTYRGPFLASSDDDGITWMHEQVADERIVGRFLQHAATHDRALVAWTTYRDPGGATDIRSAVLSGGAWSGPVSLNEGGTAMMPWATQGAGSLAVAWLGTDAVGNPHGLPDDVVWRPHIRVDGALQVWNETVHTGCLGGLYDFSVLCRGGNRSPLGDFISAALPADGSVLIAAGTEGQRFNRVPVKVFGADPGPLNAP